MEKTTDYPDLHNQASGQMRGRLPQGSLKGELSGSERVKCEEGRAVLGQAKLALCFQIPSQASLPGILKPHHPLCYVNGPALSLREEIIGRSYGVKLGFQADICYEKKL